MNTKNSSPNTALLAFAGDLVPCNISKEAFSQAFRSVEGVLEQCECRDFVVNLESALPSAKVPAVNTGSSVVFGEQEIFCSVAKNTKLNITCTLANNHMADYGLSSIKDTLDILAEAGIGGVGAGLNPESARDPHIIQVNGIRIGLLAVCSTRKCVGDHLKTDIGRPLSLLDEHTAQHVSELKDQVDHVVVACHWGREFIHYPLPEDREMAYSLIDAGASLVVGHHPHVLQGYERYKNGLIIYSLGNFIFPEQTHPQPLRWNKNERTGALAVINFSKKTVSLECCIPLRLQRNNELEILQGYPRHQVLTRMRRWSERLSRSGYNQFFEKCVRIMILQRLVTGIARNILKPQKKHFFMMFRLIRQGLRGRKSFLS